MTTLAVRMPDDLLQRLDELVSAGAYRNRTAAVKAALERFVADECNRAIDSAIVEGYTRYPPEKPTRFTHELAKRSIEQESW